MNPSDILSRNPHGFDRLAAALKEPPPKYWVEKSTGGFNVVCWHGDSPEDGKWSLIEVDAILNGEEWAEQTAWAICRVLNEGQP